MKKTNTQIRIIDMYLRAMAPDNGLPGGARAHIEYVLGNEYRHTSPCRDCGDYIDKDRPHESKAA